MRFISIWHVIVAGLLLRLLFYLWGSAIYFGSPKPFIQGDTPEFFAAIYNLIHYGIFTIDPENPLGLFGRMPGYPYLVGFFYLLTGNDYELGLKLLVIFQVFFDSFIIYIFYKTVKNITDNELTALIAAVLYASYPFVILWTSVAYAEIMGVNLAVLSLFFSSRRHDPKTLFFSGLFAAAGSLFRPQILFLTASMSLAIFIYRRTNFSLLVKELALYSIGFLILFSVWPIRNYMLSGEIILTKKIEGTSRFMSADRLNFAYFMWAIKTDWEPQISQLIHGQEVEFPEWVWNLSVEDSLKLRKALKMSYECSDGFAQLRRLPKIPAEYDCTNETAQLWKELRQSVIEKAPLRYYLLVPLGNLKKALFKTSLIKSYNRPDKTFFVDVFASVLFIYRSLLLLLGMVGLINVLQLKKHSDTGLPVLYIGLFFLIWYFYLCFVYRDMDMRYLLPADVYMLIPAAIIMSGFSFHKAGSALRYCYQFIRADAGRQLAMWVTIAFLIRLAFFLWGAELYFDSNLFFIQGDTFDFLAPFQNLLQYGTFATNFYYPDAVMGREPGYPFIMGFFYLLSGRDTHLMLSMILFLQILFDSLIVIILYQTILNIFRNQQVAFLGVALYVFYPFIIIWTSVVYAETFGVHLCILTVYFASRKRNRINIFLAGAFAALATFLRPQAVFLTASFMAALLIARSIHWREIWKPAAIFTIGFFLVYIWWPARNLIHYGEIEFFKRVENAARSLSPDQLNFAYFMWAVKTDWEPQISQLLQKRKVEMPDWVWKMSPEDSIKLVRALELSDRCGDGFAQLRQQPKLPREQDCTNEVAALWKELRTSVKKKEPLCYYLLVPLSNLKKALFKIHLIQSFNRPDKDPLINTLVMLLFLMRTTLLLCGCLGILLLLLNKNHNTFNYFAIKFIGIYALMLYFYLCFVYRDMDMRYLLPADVLLIIPAAFFIDRVWSKFYKEKSVHTGIA
jgi:Gpi18-like mannosyltransferase